MSILGFDYLIPGLIQAKALLAHTVERALIRNLDLGPETAFRIREEPCIHDLP